MILPKTPTLPTSLPVLVALFSFSIAASEQGNVAVDSMLAVQDSRATIDTGVTVPLTAPSLPLPPKRVPNLAVLAFTGNTGIDPDELKAVAGRLESELMRTGAFRVVERRNIDAILREQGLQESGACTTSDCQVEVGQILGVERIVSGELTHMGKLWSLTVRQVDVSSGALVTSHVLDIHGKLETVLRGGCPQIADILSGKTKPTETRTVLQERSSNTWLWVVGGSAIAAGGVIAVILLSQDDNKTETTPTREVSVSW